MIIEKDKQIDFKSNAVFEGHDAQISPEDMHKLWDLLQDPYKNPIGAVVREYVSNCFDSHSEAKTDDAVHVRIGKDDTGHYWSCEDFGVGLSPDRMKNVFVNYLKSTKENTNDMIGAFGIGSKSGLSYTDVVNIRTRVAGIEYTYILRKGEKSPRLEKLFEEPTTEGNGTIYL
jgi:HSP90 family molecular chaperone